MNQWQSCERDVFLLLAPGSLTLSVLQKGTRKNSSWEGEGINALCQLIGQWVTDSLNRGIDSRKEIDLWLLQPQRLYAKLVELEIHSWIITVKTLTVLGLARILRKVLEIWNVCCHLILKNSQNIYKMNKVNFVEEVGNRKHCLQLDLFHVTSPLMSQKTVSITFFTDHYNFFFTWECVSTPWTIFKTQAHCGKPMFSPFENIFFNKTYFAIDIIHSFVNFTWFANLSHQTCSIASKQIFLQDWNNFCHKPIPNNAKFTFRQKVSLVYWMTLVDR